MAAWLRESKRPLWQIIVEWKDAKEESGGDEWWKSEKPSMLPEELVPLVERMFEVLFNPSEWAQFSRWMIQPSSVR